MPVLDTSFLIDIEREQPAAVEALKAMVREAEPMVVPAQAAIEYLAGLADPVQGLHKLDAAFAVANLTQEHILEAARVAREAQRRGQSQAWADIQIAAVAHLEGMSVVTGEPRAFVEMGCEVWAYRSGKARGTGGGPRRSGGPASPGP